MGKINFYDILGLKADAKEDEIREAYRIRARSLHPDVNKSVEANKEFILIQEAYSTLLDPELRAVYNTEMGIVLEDDYAFNTFSKGTAFLRKQKEIQDSLKRRMGLDDEDFYENEPNLLKGSISGNQLSSPKKLNKTSKDQLLGERVFQFQIDALESLLGTERPIVIKTKQAKEKKILVKIPPGIDNNAIIRIKANETIPNPIKAIINIIDHSELQRKNEDIYLSLPIHASEKPQIIELELFTLKSLVKIKIDTEKMKTQRIKEHGIHKPGTAKAGNFYISFIDAPIGQSPEETKTKRRINAMLVRPLHFPM